MRCNIRRYFVCSLDHFVSAGEQRRRYFQAERLSGVEIDDKLEFRWLLDRQVGRFGALEYPIDEVGRPAIQAGQVHAITDQTAKASLFAAASAAIDSKL